MLKRMLIGLKNNWLLFVIVALFTISIISFEVTSNNYRTQKTLSEVGAQLTTLAELKAVQLQNWRSERIIDGLIIQTDVDFSNAIRSIVQDPSDQENIKKCMERLRSLLADPNYSSILLFDDTGEEILRVGEIGDKPSDLVIGGNPEIQMSSLHKAADGTVQMDLVVPVFISGDQHQTLLAYLIYIINPDVIVYPLIQSLPTAYNTAETLLVHKENEEVVFLNELRFRNETALQLRIPLSESQVPAVMAVNGVTGIVNGKDYRSVPVMASIVPIEGTDWILLAKIDMEEIYIPIRQQVVSTTMVVIFLIIIGVASVIFLWRRQSASITTGLSISEKRRKNLEEKYSTLFNQANDAILLVEENGKIFEANAQAVKMYGYTQEELLSLTIADLRDDSTKFAIPTDMGKVKNGSSNTFETTHKKKNGDLFAVEVSSRYLSIDGKGFFQSLVRDITDKKKAEEALRLSELALKKAQAVSHVGSWNWNLLTKKVDWSDEMFNIFGLPLEHKSMDFSELMNLTLSPADFDKISQVGDTAIKNNETFSLETHIKHADGTMKDIWVEAGELIYDQQGKVIEVSGIVQDITEMKKAERELRKSENLLQRIYDLLPVGLWITNEKGKLIRSNKMVKEIWGKDILVSEAEFDVFKGRRLPSGEEIKPDDWASVHTISEGVTIRDEMIEIDAYDGKTKTILNYTTPILDDDGKMEGAIILNMDITELKKAEELLSAQLDELRRWNLATLGRENRIRELKAEINKLLLECGKEPIYKSVADDDNA